MMYLVPLTNWIFIITDTSVYQQSFNDVAGWTIYDLVDSQTKQDI